MFQLISKVIVFVIPGPVGIAVCVCPGAVTLITVSKSNFIRIGSVPIVLEHPCIILIFSRGYDGCHTGSTAESAGIWHACWQMCVVVDIIGVFTSVPGVCGIRIVLHAVFR